MEEELLPFMQRLNLETLNLADECPLREVAFTKYIVSQIYTFFDCNDPQFCHAVKTNAKGDIVGEIHGYAISKNGEVLTLFYSLLSAKDDSVATFNNSDCQVALNRMQGFFKEAAIRNLAFDYEDDYREFDETYYAAKDILGYYHDNDKLKTVELCILSNANISNCEIKNIRIPNLHVVPTVWDLKKLMGFLSSEKDHIDIDIDFTTEYKYKIPYIKMESTEYQYQCILAMFPAKLLYRLYERWNTKLLLSNVRYYLGTKKTSRNTTNAGMIETLENENQMFLAYNNGITALASGFTDIADALTTEKIDVSDEEKDPALVSDGSEEMMVQKNYISMGILHSLSDFRIVNGGQTTATLFEAKHPKKKSAHKSVSFDGVYVQVKILIFNNDKEDQMASAITRYSNTQNPVKYSDFTVSNPFNKGMEKLSREIKVPTKNGEVRYWYFERLRGQHGVELKRLKDRASQDTFKTWYPDHLCFCKEDVARVNTAWQEQPADAVKGIGTCYDIFIEEMKNIVPDEAFYRKTIALLIIYRYLFHERSAANKLYANAKASVICYTMAYLHNCLGNQLNLEKIWQDQSLSIDLKQYLNLLADRVFDTLTKLAAYSGKPILSYGKTKDAYSAMRACILPLSKTLIPNDLK